MEAISQGRVFFFGENWRHNELRNLKKYIRKFDILRLRVRKYFVAVKYRRIIAIVWLSKICQKIVFLKTGI